VTFCGKERGERPVRIHVGNAEVASELISYFEDQADCVVAQVSETEIEVSLLGSYRLDRHDAAVQRRLAAFRAESNGHLHPAGAFSIEGNGDPEPGPAAA
jgi:hypothetical protein